MKQLHAGLAILVSVLGASAVASAGVVIEFQHKSPRDEQPVKGSVALETDRLRMQTGEQTMIFRGDKPLVWILQPSEKSYMEMNQETAAQMGDAMAKMQEQLKNMPPEQRAMMEKMMAGKMGAAGAPEEPIAIKKTGKSETVGGHACDWYDVERGGKNVSSMCVADWKGFDLKPADFKVFEQMGEFMKTMAGPFARRMGAGFTHKYGEGPNQVPGVPVKTVIHGDMGDSVQEIVKVAHEDVAAAQFELPAGLTKREMNMGGPPRGGPR